MSTTITITVDEGAGVATVTTGAKSPPSAELGESASGGAPPPAPLGELGGIAAEELAGGEEGPPPLEPGELGLDVAVGAGAAAGGPPPEDLVEASNADDIETVEPMPLEDLENAEKPPRATRKKT